MEYLNEMDVHKAMGTDGNSLMPLQGYSSNGHSDCKKHVKTRREYHSYIQEGYKEDMENYSPRDLNRLERSLVNVSKGKCQILYLEKKNSMHQFIQESHYLKRSFAKSGLGVLVDNKPAMHPQSKGGQ
ncbi:hypothetical protein BTVI_12186 [Pitangus sulphuratus]|nr:hypothetical protein BTVI_12186 [Pitangus sulphuratus]